MTGPAAERGGEIPRGAAGSSEVDRGLTHSAPPCTLIPIRAAAICPHCGHRHDLDLADDGHGIHRVPPARRYIGCAGCGRTVDAGHDGWCAAEGWIDV